jgi:hypothetical protein
MKRNVANSGICGKANVLFRSRNSLILKDNELLFRASILSSTIDFNDCLGKFEIRVNQLYEPCDPAIASGCIDRIDLLNLCDDVKHSFVDWLSQDRLVQITGKNRLNITFRNNQYIDIDIELNEQQSSDFRDEVRRSAEDLHRGKL